jgi:hypothetical protein
LHAKAPDRSAQDLVRETVGEWFEEDGASTAGSGTAMEADEARALFGAWTEDDLEARAEDLVALAQTVWSPLIAAKTAAKEKKDKKEKGGKR